MNELTLLGNADARALAYTAGIDARRVFPDAAAIDRLAAFDELLPRHGFGAEATLGLLDEAGSPATVASNGARSRAKHATR